MDVKNIKINLPWKRLFKISGNALFIFVFVIALLMILSKFNVGGLRVLTVRSGSMSPAIFTGSVTFVSPAKTYNVNDIITFRAQGKKELVTHRIVEADKSTDKNFYWTKGDANDAPDSYKVPQIGIIGKVRFSLPLLGYMVDFAKTIPGLMLLIIIPATIIIYDEIRKIKKEMAKLKLEKNKKDNFTSFPFKENNSKKGKIWAILKKHRKLFVFTIILTTGLLFSNSTYAVTEMSGDLTISYPGDPPLFSELNLAPGDTTTKTITITNDGDTTQDIAIAVTDYNDPDNLASKLNIFIKKGVVELYGGLSNPKYLSDLFSAGEVYLATLDSSITTDYDFEITFDPEADNNYQGKITIFDFSIGFIGTPTTITPTPTVLGEETEELTPQPIKILGVELPETGVNILKFVSILVGFTLVLAIFPTIIYTIREKLLKKTKS